MNAAGDLSRGEEEELVGLEGQAGQTGFFPAAVVFDPFPVGGVGDFDAASIRYILRQGVIAVQVVGPIELGNVDSHVGILPGETLALDAEKGHVVGRPPGLQVAVLSFVWKRWEARDKMS